MKKKNLSLWPYKIFLYLCSLIKMDYNITIL
jgi:hypothetical protein